ncbi:MAG TPA: hypothetical protein VJ739_12200 [Gemmataceae bacterium]|nr:hypothetical protein [Gemmataceae bacterium]
MTEEEWQECEYPGPMVSFLRNKVSVRKLRLFFCACCRSIWHVLDEPFLRRAVETAERHADGQAPDAELGAMQRELLLGPRFARPNARAEAVEPTVTQGVFHVGSLFAVADLAYIEVTRQLFEQGRMHNPPDTRKRIQRSHAALLRCVVGPLPFRTVPLNPAWLAWNDRTVLRLAQAVYDDRAFDRLPILADALEEAGCAEADILGHLRGPGPHARGCWVVDLLLTKN